MDFEIAIVGIGLAREKAFELASRRLGAEPLERRLGFGDDAGLALGLAELDQLECVGDLALDPPVASDRLVEAGALAQQLLRTGRVVPQVLILGLRVQLGEAPGRRLPVKDASSAAPATS
jgi:hypothetical protein